MKTNLDENLPNDIRDVFNNKTTASSSDDNLAGEESVKTACNKQKQGDTTMEKTEITEVVKAEVQAIFAAKDSQAQVEEKFTVLEEAKAELQGKNDELVESNKTFAEKVSSLEEEINVLKASNEAIASEKDAAVADCQKAQEELKDIKKEQVKAQRKETLSSEKLLISDETLQNKQIANISEMTDEQFNDYVQEIKAIANSSQEADKETQAEANKDEESKKEDGQATASVNANFTAGEIMKQAIATTQKAPATNNDVALMSQL